jgi:hypothetical protein
MVGDTLEILEDEWEVSEVVPPPHPHRACLEEDEVKASLA